MKLPKVAKEETAMHNNDQPAEATLSVDEENAVNELSARYAMDEIRDINSDLMCDALCDKEEEWCSLIDAYEKGHPDEIKSALDKLIKPLLDEFTEVFLEKAEFEVVRGFNQD